MCVSLTLREQQRLMGFKNRVLRKIFGPKSQDITGDWRQLHSEELHNLYSMTNIIWVNKSMRMKGGWVDG